MVCIFAHAEISKYKLYSLYCQSVLLSCIALTSTPNFETKRYHETLAERIVDDDSEEISHIVIFFLTDNQTGWTYAK